MTLKYVRMVLKKAVNAASLVAGHRGQALHEVGRRVRHRHRMPAQLIRRRRHLVEATADVPTKQARVDLDEGSMDCGGPDAIEPRAPVMAARRGECRARQLLGVETMRRMLRRVAAFGQCARHGFGCELVAEARLIGQRPGRG